jgi:hypothetical protein
MDDEADDDQEDPDRQQDEEELQHRNPFACTSAKRP